MNDHASAPNGSTSLTLEDQRLIPPHTEKKELFHISKIENKIKIRSIKRNIIISKRKNMYHMLIL